MRREIALSACAVTAALIAAIVVPNAADAVAAKAPVPVPLPTHAPTDPCSPPGPQQQCDVMDALTTGAMYRCRANADLWVVRHDGSTAATGTFEFEGHGGHACPNSAGDWVMVQGTLFVTFNGFPLGPFRCAEWRECGTRSGNTLSYETAAAKAITKAVTASYDRPDGIAADEEVFLYP